MHFYGVVQETKPATAENIARDLQAAVIKRRINQDPTMPAAQTQAPQPAQADLDAWRCDRCNGDGWHYVEREGVDPRDIVRTKEHCEECDGIGWCGPDARIAAGLLPHSVAEVVFFDPASRGPLPEKSGLIIDASLAFFRSAKIGDKLYSQAQMRAALSRCAIPAPEGAQLPPLPEPEGIGYYREVTSAAGTKHVYRQAPSFTADQMHAYARAALAAPRVTEGAQALTETQIERAWRLGFRHACDAERLNSDEEWGYKRANVIEEVEALAAPAPQDSLDSAQPSKGVAMQAAPVTVSLCPSTSASDWQEMRTLSAAPQTKEQP